MRQITVEEFLAFLDNNNAETIDDINSINEELQQAANEDNSGCWDYPNIPDDGRSIQDERDTIEHGSANDDTPLLDRVVRNFLLECERTNTLPTYEQAKSMELLVNIITEFVED